MGSLGPTLFGTLLRRHRLNAGLSQEALAERAGLSIDAIRALERGRRSTPRPDTLGMLASGLNLSPTERIALVASVAGADPADAAPVAPPPSRRLPVRRPPDALIGREPELARAADLLQREGTRLLTFVGPGGVGKTRLASELLVRLEGDYNDGAAFVDLSAIRDSLHVPATIAAALGIRDSGQQDAWERLLAFLRNSQILLALDNFEQVLEAAPLASELLEQCPEVAIIVTSRSALRIRAEQRFWVPALVTRPHRHPVNGHRGELPEAVQLFTARATSVQPAMPLDQPSLAAITTICERLDGLPLAIELAAARVSLLPPVALLSRLENRLALLTTGGLDRPDRQRTLRATMDWSYSLLNATDQAVFRAISVFAGPCTLDSAVTVCQAIQPLPPGQVEDGFASLVDKSLLRALLDDTGEPRLAMLETVREYASGQLQAHQEAELARSAHASLFLALAETAEFSIREPDRAISLARLERDHDNLRAALAYRLAAQDPAPALRLAAALWEFWWAHGHFAEGRGWLDRALDAAPRDDPFRARALLGAGYLAMQQSDWPAARAHMEEGLDLSRVQCDRLLEARLLRELGLLLTYSSEYETARRHAEDALAIGRTLDNPEATEGSLLILGRILRSLGAFDDAEAHLREALDIARGRDAVRSIATAHVILGDIARFNRDLAPAAAEYAAGLVAAREAEHSTYMAWAIAGLGQVAMWRGQTIRARIMLEQALTIYRDLGNLHSICFVTRMLGLTAWRAGDLDRAEALCREALAIGWQIGQRAGCADHLEALGLVALARSNPTEATRLFAAAVARRAPFLFVPELIVQDLVTVAIREARNALGDQAFADAWAAGLATPLANMVEAVLIQER